MRGTPERHLAAADKHDAAARAHERSAGFWDKAGDADRSSLQRALARHERRGAELERRWAALVARDNGKLG